jgi:hypothetical protein
MFAVRRLCICTAPGAMLGLFLSAVPAQNASRESVTLGSLDPSLSGTLGFGGQPYAALIPNTAPTDSASGARVERFVAPDGKLITLSIAAPKVYGIYRAAPIHPGEDPADYFAKVIAQAGSHTTLVLPKDGRYDFSAVGCQKGGAHLKLTGATDIVIDGAGSVLNFTAPCAGLALVDPTRVLLKDFTIDWPGLRIASLGMIVSSGGTGPRQFTYDLQVDRAYSGDALPPRYKSINAWDADRGYWSLQHPDHEVGYNPPQPLSPAGQARGVQSWGAHFVQGEHVLIRHYTTEGDAIDIYHGQDVTLQNVTIHSSPGFGVAVLQGSSRFVMSDCRITRAAGRLISTAADALHIDDFAGDALIENNVFAYQGDDGFNMNATLLGIASGGTNVIPVPASHRYIRRGDSIALFSPVMRLDHSTTWRVVDITSNTVDGTHLLTLDHPIPPLDKGGFLLDLAFAGARYMLLNNQFLRNRARGALLQTPYGLVQGNTFSGQTMHALFLTVFPPEGAGAQNVVIADNTISDGGVGGGPGAVVVSRGRTIYSGATGNPPVHQNLIFSDNRVTDVPGPAFYISAANAVVLYRNTLRNANSHTLENRWNGAGDLNFPIVINDASNILLRANTMEAARSGSAEVFIDTPTTTGIRISDR